jgi:hypothetical protein
MNKRAVDANGNPTGAKDERGVLLDLSARDVEALGKAGGDPAAYLAERRRQIAELIEKRREADDKRRYVAAFVTAGGMKTDAEAAYKAHKNEQAATAAQRADQEAVIASRQRIRQAL